MSRAEVIKVEHPIRGDDTRVWGPPFAKYLPESGKDGPGDAAYFLSVCSGLNLFSHTNELLQVNRNKKSLGLSFQYPSGVAVLHKLAKASDIVVENYLPGTLKKYNMDYETLRKI